MCGYEDAATPPSAPMHADMPTEEVKTKDSEGEEKADKDVADASTHKSKTSKSIMKNASNQEVLALMELADEARELTKTYINYETVK